MRWRVGYCVPYYFADFDAARLVEEEHFGARWDVDLLALRMGVAEHCMNVRIQTGCNEAISELKEVQCIRFRHRHEKCGNVGVLECCCS